MLRILSDLHFRDASSHLRRLEDLAPVLEGVSTLWLNGDTCDNQTGMPESVLQELRGFFRQRVPEVQFITGNHDPDISNTHHCSAAADRLFAIHGDVFLDDVVPWSRVRDKIRTRIRQAQYDHPEFDIESLDGRVALFRLACTGFQRECDPERRDALHRIRRLATELFPPRQPWAMLRTWMTLADRVAIRHPQWCPQAQVVVTGHVHFPRVWRRGPLTIVNTGAFTGPLGAWCVDYLPDTVTVRRLNLHHGQWHPGATMATIPLAPTPSAP